MIQKALLLPEIITMTILQKYANLLIDYCLDIQPGQKLYVKSSTAAEPLLREIYRAGIKAGGHVVIDMSFREQSRILLNEGNAEQLAFVAPSYEAAMKEFDAFLVVRAPENLKEDQNVNRDNQKQRSQSLQWLSQLYFERTADGSLTRSLCQYPTNAGAQEAGMSLEEYEQFIFNACKLYEDDPKAAWLKVRERQQAVVDYLNKAEHVQYKNGKTDISFSVAGRTWINSDGRTNMPSGEVFSGPVEDSVNGTVYFNYPSIFMGTEVRGITLEVENGKVKKWSAEQGEEVLDKVFEIDGARFFGEVAIGTNYSIQQPTKNILFDEKIGGTIHMAVGQSYKQTGGKNMSAIHWDMITDMKNGGEIFVDGELAYKDGKFLNFKLQ